MSLKALAGITSLVAATLLPMHASAQDAPVASDAPMAAAKPTTMLGNWGWSFHLGQLNLDPVAAKRVRFDESTVFMTIAGERSWNDYNMSLSTGLNIMLYQDNGGFKQNTTQGMKESSASGGTFHIQGGPQMRLGENDAIKVFLHAGYNQVLSSSRNIEDCSNCHSESISLSGGPYIATGIGYAINNINWGIQYTKYSSGDFKDSISLRVSTAF